MAAINICMHAYISACGEKNENEDSDCLAVFGNLYLDVLLLSFQCAF